MADRGLPDQKGKRSVRFSRTTWMALSLLFLGWAFLYIELGDYTAADKAAYDEMINGDPATQPETQVSKQNRVGMQKSVFLQNGYQHRQLMLRSAHSDLALEKTDRHIEIVEHLHDVECLFQENVYYVLPDGSQAFLQADGRLLLKGKDPRDPVSWISRDDPLVSEEQIIFMLKADNAIYHYKGEVFEAEKAKLYRYITPNHQLNIGLDSKIIAEGEASEVKFSLGREAYFQADDFKAKFFLSPQNTEEVSIAADHASYDGKNIVLTGHARVSNHHDVVTANFMDLRLDDEESTEKSEKKQIQSFLAEGNVIMTYKDSFTALADKAEFQRNPKAPEKERLPGIITLSCSQDKLCRVIGQHGDDILSNQIAIDTVKRESTFSFPTGSLALETGGRVTFKADRMIWNDLTSRLTLSDHVDISQMELGKIQAAHDVVLVLTTIDGKEVLRGIETIGDATLTYTDPEGGLDHTLKSYGSLRINHQKMETRLQSPVNADGVVLPGQQVYFKDAKGDIYADKVFIKYDYIDKKIVPARIALQGNVKIANNLEKSEKDKTKAMQYILADRVDFIPRTKEMVFKASPGKRVLLFDKANNLEVSAPGLKLTRDKAASKEILEGLGNVRFSFVESELEQFKRHFLFEKN